MLGVKGLCFSYCPGHGAGRIREAERARCDRNDVAVVVDGVDAVLQHLLAGTAWIPRKRELVSGACHTVGRRGRAGR